MSNRRNSYSNRCPKCSVNQIYCCCTQIKALKILTRVDIIMHKLELYQSSNTAKLSKQSLPENAHLHYRGHKDLPLDTSFINPASHFPIYLFPFANAPVLTPNVVLEAKKPIQLIIPDGRWSQAQKIYRREPALSSIDFFKLPDLGKSQYVLRRQTNAHRLCTHEAIAHALGIIENPEVEEIMMDNLNHFVQAHLRSRTNPVSS